MTYEEWEASLRPATIKEIRKHFAERNYEVRISGGYVRFRPIYRNVRDRHWRDGGWVEEYHTDRDGNVHHI